MGGTAFSAGGSCEQSRPGQGCPLFDVVRPVLSLSTTASLTLQGAPKGGIWEVVHVPDGGGGGGFFLACEDFRKCSTIHSPPVLFFFLSGN